MNLRAIDICCGAGGWSVAARGLPITVTDAWDWDTDACATHRANHQATDVHQADIRTVNFRPFAGKVDLVLGAVPCEEISVARNSKKASAHILRDWQALLDSILAAVDAINPRWWVLENVIQMRKHLPPLTPYLIIDSAEYSAQKRRRIYVGKFPRPAPGTDTRVLRDCLRPGPHQVNRQTLEAPTTSTRQWYGPRTKRILDPDRKSPTITNFGNRYSRAFTIQQSAAPPRALNFHEAAALQGFPEDFVFVAALFRATKLVGQAVQIHTARAILQAIIQAHHQSE